MDHLVAAPTLPEYGPARSETKSALVKCRPALARSSPREEEPDDFAFRSGQLLTIHETHAQSLWHRARPRLVDTYASYLPENSPSTHVPRRPGPCRAELRSAGSKADRFAKPPL